MQPMFVDPHCRVRHPPVAHPMKRRLQSLPRHWGRFPSTLTAEDWRA